MLLYANKNKNHGSNNNTISATKVVATATAIVEAGKGGGNNDDEDEDDETRRKKTMRPNYFTPDDHLWKTEWREWGAIVRGTFSGNYFRKMDYLLLRVKRYMSMWMCVLCGVFESFLPAPLSRWLRSYSCLFGVIHSHKLTLLLILHVYMPPKLSTFLPSFCPHSKRKIPIVYTLSTQIWIIKSISVHNFRHSSAKTIWQNKSRFVIFKRIWK